MKWDFLHAFILKIGKFIYIYIYIFSYIIRTWNGLSYLNLKKIAWFFILIFHKLNGYMTQIVFYIWSIFFSLFKTRQLFYLKVRERDCVIFLIPTASETKFHGIIMAAGNTGGGASMFIIFHNPNWLID